MTTYTTKLSSLHHTEQFASRIAHLLSAAIQGSGVTLGLVGDLGGGKTTFTRALVASLGVTDSVSSPTFVLCHEYSATSGTIISHWDLYRLKASIPEELFDPPRSRELRVIEWIDRSEALCADAAAVVRFELANEDERVVTVTINPRCPWAAQWGRELQA